MYISVIVIIIIIIKLIVIKLIIIKLIIIKLINNSCCQQLVGPLNQGHVCIWIPSETETWKNVYIVRDTSILLMKRYYCKRQLAKTQSACFILGQSSMSLSSVSCVWFGTSPSGTL